MNTAIDNELIQAVKQGNINEVKRLISKGADVNAQGNDKWTALHWAVLQKHENIVAFLLKEEKVNVGMFKKVCQTAFLIQLNFQPSRKKDIKLRYS